MRASASGRSGVGVTRRNWLATAGASLALGALAVETGGCALKGAERHIAAGRAHGGGDEGPWFMPLGDDVDWQAQDHRGSGGVTSARLDGGRLIVQLRLSPPPEEANGEVFLDLQHVWGLEGCVPVDFSQRTIHVELDIPEGLIGWRSSYNGVQVFVQDDGTNRDGTRTRWRSQYSEWQDIRRAGRYPLTLSPRTKPIPGGHQDAKFDPTRIRSIGVKIGIGGESRAQFAGAVTITKVEIRPPIRLSSLPALSSSPVERVFGPADVVRAEPGGIHLNGRKWFVLGANWRVLEYGQTFGRTESAPRGNGIGVHPNLVRANLSLLRQTGLKVVRVGLFKDGRAVLDRDGSVGRHYQMFRNDVRIFLDLAAQADTKVELTLVDFLIAGKAQKVDGVWVRGRGAIIEDDAVRQAFLRELLVPFLSEFGQHPAVLGFDIINEPEWVVSQADGGGWEDVKDRGDQAKRETPIAGAAMRAFIADCIRMVRVYAPGRLVTVGVSCPMIALVRDLDVDYFALHHYPWMESLESYLSGVPRGKSWILEEYPTRLSEAWLERASPEIVSKSRGRPNSHVVTDYLDRVERAGGAGALLWNWRPGADDWTLACSERRDVVMALRGWAASHR